MEIRISARHEEFDSDVKAYAERKLDGLTRYYRGTRSVEVVLDGDASSTTVELKAHLDRGAPLIVTAAHPEPMAAIDVAHGKLERALHRLKEKLEDRRHGKGHSAPPTVAPEPSDPNDVSGTIPDLYA